MTGNLTSVSEESLQASMRLEKWCYIHFVFNASQHGKKVMAHSRCLGPTVAVHCCIMGKLEVGVVMVSFVVCLMLMILFFYFCDFFEHYDFHRHCHHLLK